MKFSSISVISDVSSDSQESNCQRGPGSSSSSSSSSGSSSTSSTGTSSSSTSSGSSSNLYLLLNRTYIVTYVRHVWTNKSQLINILKQYLQAWINKFKE